MSEDPDDDHPSSNESEPSFEISNSESVVDSLVEELQQGGVSDQQIETLRSELSIEHPKSMEVRLRYIQSRMEEFTAYIEGLEEIIDVHGEATEFLDEIYGRLDELQDHLDQLREELNASATDREEIKTELEQTTNDVNSLETRIETGFENTLQELTKLKETHSDDIGNMKSELNDLKNELAEVDSSLTTTYEKLQTELDDLTEKVQKNTKHRERLAEALRIKEQSE